MLVRYIELYYIQSEVSYVLKITSFCILLPKDYNSFLLKMAFKIFGIWNYLLYNLDTPNTLNKIRQSLCCTAKRFQVFLS